MKPTISVLIPTYNRAGILRETLEAMSKVERSGLSADFVVIDNNSKDNTKNVVDLFKDRLPILYLFEPRQGKSCALNKALEEVELGEIVVFTDDDVMPHTDWLKQIADSCRRNPEYALGGGKVITAWPGNREPEWLRFSKTSCGLRGHDLGQHEMLYPDDNCPIGPNFWIRRYLFENGLRFDESIGPSTIKRAMGEETYLLNKLKHDGYKIVYCPDSILHHRLQKSLITPRGIQHRAYTMGRGSARIKFLCYTEINHNHKLSFLLRRACALGFACLRLLIAYLSFSQARRIGRSIDPIVDIAYNWELLTGENIYSNHKQKTNV